MLLRKMHLQPFHDCVYFGHILWHMMNAEVLMTTVIQKYNNRYDMMPPFLSINKLYTKGNKQEELKSNRDLLPPPFAFNTACCWGDGHLD